MARWCVVFAVVMLTGCSFLKSDGNDDDDGDWSDDTGTTGSSPEFDLDANSVHLIVPGDMQISWSDDYNELHDRIGVVMMGEVMVETIEEGRPVEDFQVEMVSAWGGVYLIPAEAVKLVSYPETSVDPTDQAAIEEACTDEDGNFKSEPEWCAWYWDTESGQYYQIGGEYIATESNYEPNYLVGETNNRGLFKFYMYVDAMPWLGDGGEETGGSQSYGSASIQASIGVDSDSFSIRVDES